MVAKQNAVLPVQVTAGRPLRLVKWQHGLSVILSLHFLLQLNPCGAFGVSSSSPTVATAATKDLKFQIQKECASLIDSNRPITSTILNLPFQSYTSEDDEELCFQQAATSLVIRGYSQILNSCNSFERTFQSDQDVQACTRRISWLSSNSLRIDWNVTWVPPSAAWLETLARVWPGWQPDYRTYNHLSDRRTTFSWKAVGQLLKDAIQLGQVKVPMACIEGITTLELNPQGKVRKISEELVYAIELQRGVLRNRRCSDDLRVFLETARRPPGGFLSNDKQQNWDDAVADCLPWSCVPGSNVMDVDPIEEGPAAAIGFLAVVTLTIVAFANVMGPELIGQSLWGPPNSIVRPEDLNSFY